MYQTTVWTSFLLSSLFCFFIEVSGYGHQVYPQSQYPFQSISRPSSYGYNSNNNYNNMSPYPYSSQGFMSPNYGMSRFSRSTDSQPRLGLLTETLEPAARIKRRVSRGRGTSQKLSKLSALVKTLKLEDCAGKVVCDLSCQPDFFGGDGKSVLKTLLSIQTSGKMDKDEMKFYLNAGVVGRKAKSERKGCLDCQSSYPSCSADSADLIDVVSLIKIDL